MSAFEDYCIVCEKLCIDGSAYCSEICKDLDKENDSLDLEMSHYIVDDDNLNSPALSASSFTLNQSDSLVQIDSNSSNATNIPNNNNNNNTNNNNNNTRRSSRLHSKSISLNQIPTSMVSPLLTPQIVPVSRNGRHSSIVGSIKSPNFKDLTYESPLLATSHSTCSNLVLNDLDSNDLDLNIDSTPITTINERLSQSIANSHAQTTQPVHPDSRKVMTVNNIISANNSSSKKITSVSNLLHSSSENYKKWLSIH